MRRLKRLWSAAIAAYATDLLREAAEARRDIDRIEAAAVDAFQTDLANVAGTPKERQNVRDMAILLAQLGIRAEEVEEMARVYLMARGYGINSSDLRHLGSIIGRPTR